MISVIVPIYNSEKYLPKCLNSLANQSFKDLEVILINDGSTDSSQKICEDFCNKYKNFKLINKKNGGQMSAWILGLKYVSGEFVGFVDSDDWIEKDFYKKMHEAQKIHDADLVMCGRTYYFEGKDTETFTRPLIIEGFYSSESTEQMRKMFLPTFDGNLSQARWDKLFKTKLYKECTNKYCQNPVRTFEDRFIVVPYVFYSSSFEFIKEPLYNVRVVENSSSKKTRPELCEISDLLFESHKRLIQDLNVYDDYISNIELEKIDILRAIFQRNICINLPYKKLKLEAKKILSKTNREIVLRHKKDCKGKFGTFFKLCCRLNSPFLLIIGGKIVKRSK